MNEHVAAAQAPAESLPRVLLTGAQMLFEILCLMAHNVARKRGS